LAIGAAAAGGLAILAGIIAWWRARVNARSGKGKHEGRIARRAFEEFERFDFEEDEELLEALVEFFSELEAE
jgi:hypothetical protein